MPGYELIDNKEFSEISEIFKKSKTLFRMGFEKQRKGIFKVEEFLLLIRLHKQMYGYQMMRNLYANFAFQILH